MALELLDYHFADDKVRSLAVERLEKLSNEELLVFLLQLMQVPAYCTGLVHSVLLAMERGRELKEEKKKCHTLQNQPSLLQPQCLGKIHM